MQYITVGLNIGKQCTTLEYFFPVAQNPVTNEKIEKDLGENSSIADFVEILNDFDDENFGGQESKGDATVNVLFTSTKLHSAFTRTYMYIGCQALRSVFAFYVIYTILRNNK